MTSQSPHRIKIISGPDRLGRYMWFAYWMSDYHPGHPDGEHRWAERGQVSSGIPSERDIPLFTKALGHPPQVIVQ